MYGIGIDETPTVYWVVPCNAALRHAIRARPGALVHGERTPTECGISAKVPFSTPVYRMPPTALIIDRCPDCATAIENRQDHTSLRHVTWDF